MWVRESVDVIHPHKRTSPQTPAPKLPTLFRLAARMMGAGQDQDFADHFIVDLPAVAGELVGGGLDVSAQGIGQDQPGRRGADFRDAIRKALFY